MFTLFGTTYGGDGVTNFALPDLRGRLVVDNGPALPIGAVFGQYDVQLTDANFDGLAPNRAPIAGDDVFVLGFGPDLVASLLDDNGGGADFDFKGQPHSTAAGEFVTSGGACVRITDDGSFGYDAPAAGSGIDGFSYTVVDVGGRTDVGSVLIDVGGVGGLTSAADGPEALHGGGGTNDALSYFRASSGVYVRLFDGAAKKAAAGDVFDGFENLIGGAYGDNLVGDVAENALLGFSGNDFLRGGGGNDRLAGGLNDDRLEGGAGRDAFVHRPGDGHDRVLDFEIGVDTLDLRGHGVSDIEALARYAIERPGSVYLDLPGGDGVVLDGLGRADLYAADILI